MNLNAFLYEVSVLQTLRLQIVHLVRYMLACTSVDSNLFWRMMNTRWHVFQHTHHYSIKVAAEFIMLAGEFVVSK